MIPSNAKLDEIERFANTHTHVPMKLDLANALVAEIRRLRSVVFEQGRKLMEYEIRTGLEK